MCGIFLKVVLLVTNIQVNQNVYERGEQARPTPGRTKPADEGGREGGAIGEEASLPCYELFLAGEAS